MPASLNLPLYISSGTDFSFEQFYAFKLKNKATMKLSNINFFIFYWFNVKIVFESKAICIMP